MFDLFTGLDTSIPQTEGIKYAGSKLKIYPYILSIARELKPQTIFDGFSGTTRVAQAFAQCGYSVRTNDRAVWSEVFAKCYLLNKKPKSFYIPIIEYLNNLKPRDGWFTENYGGVASSSVSQGKDGLKKPWQAHNTRRLDAIRDEIDNLDLTDTAKAVLITSLIYALDSVDNTLGHFASYLNNWSPRSFNNMKLTVPNIFETPDIHSVERGDIFDVLPSTEVDLAYFDPPYGSNNEKMPPSRVRYAAYYHLWTTVCLNDKPQIFGKVNRRSDTSDKLSSSVFEEFRRGNSGRFIVIESLEKLIRECKANHIILSYSSGGRATALEINQLINDNAKLLKVIEIDYKKNVMAGMRWTNEWIKHAEQPNKEFLFVLQK